MSERALEKAAALAAIRLEVFPCGEDKTPLTEHGHLDASSDPAQIKRWWSRWPDALVGVAAGRSGLVCLDIDLDHDKGVNGWEALSTAGVVPLPATLSYKTRRGGEHHVYRAPEGISLDGGRDVDGMRGVDRRGGSSYFIWWGDDVPTTRKAFSSKPPAWLVEPAKLPRITRHTDATVEAWLERVRGGKPLKTTRKAAARVPFPAGAARDAMLAVVADLVGRGTSGEPGIAKVLDATHDRYVADRPDREREWANALAGSVRHHGLPLASFAISDAEQAGRRPEPAPEVDAVTLADCDEVFTSWLGVHYDLDALHAVLAVAAGERLGGDPGWLLVLGGSGHTKTETVQTLAAAGARIVSSIASEGALLSATSHGERSKDATGGLLRELGDRGILVIKDVTTILSMDRTARAQVLAALREIYDGRWTRNVGTDGGRSLEWTGRLVLIGAVTTAWDRAHEVISSMGDRFVLVRLDSTQGRIAAGRKAIANTGNEETMRAELAAAAAGVIAGADLEAVEPNDQEAARILDAADVVTRARTAVDVDYRGNVVDAHAPEMPTRFAKQLAQIFRGACSIGLSREAALDLAIRCARDSMPPLRLEILEDVAAHEWTPLRDVTKRVDKPRSTVDRQLQSLHLLGLLTVEEDISVGTSGLSIRETTTWRYSLADGVDISGLTLTNRTTN